MRLKFCLKIKTFDKRNLFTLYKNKKLLSAYERVLFSKMEKTKYNDQIILSVNKLTLAISDHSFNANSKIFNNKNVSNNIKSYINKSFEKNKILNFEKLKNKFEKYGITKANLYNYLNNVKKSYEKDGKKIKRIRSGIFKLIAEEE
mgnify:CR=1 FL=1